MEASMIRAARTGAAPIQAGPGMFGGGCNGGCVTALWHFGQFALPSGSTALQSGQ